MILSGRGAERELARIASSLELLVAFLTKRSLSTEEEEAQDSGVLYFDPEKAYERENARESYFQQTGIHLRDFEDIPSVPK